MSGFWSFLYPNVKPCKLEIEAHTHTYQMCDSENKYFDLPIVKNKRDFGIVFENKLKFNKHVLNTVNKTNKLIGMIKRTFLCMNKTLFLTIYESH